jgi:hypothetical protein
VINLTQGLNTPSLASEIRRQILRTSCIVSFLANAEREWTAVERMDLHGPLTSFHQITFSELYSAQLARPVHQALSQIESMKQQNL